MIVRDAPPEHYGWIAERANLVVSPAFRAIEAVDDAGRIHGMVGYDGWTENAVCMHVALDNPAAARALIRVCFRIPFVRLDRGVVLAQVVGTNEKSLRLVEHLGFKLAYRVRDGWAVGLDMVWFEMRREDCRWLKEAA